MPAPSAGDRFEVEIQELAFQGPGVAKIDGLVVFVPYTAPGDLVEIELTQIKKNYAIAQITRMAKPSKMRREPPCPYFLSCGGCNWQHINYAEQLRQKNIIINNLFRELTDHIFPIIESPQEFHYRNRIQLHSKGQKLGYFKKNSHQIVDIDSCWLADQKINELIPQAKKQRLHQDSGIKFFIDDAGRAQMSLDDDFFTQINRLQIENIKLFIANKLRSIPLTRLYDFYSGAGSFSFYLQPIFPKARMTAVETSISAVSRAQKEIQKLNLSPKKFEIYCSAVDVFLKRSSISEDSVILLNPPRSGTHPRVLQAINQSKAKYLLYLSCNPSTLKRDLRLLKNAKIDFIQPFDMFPQTDHIEILAGASLLQQ